jgi:hypothetical protein
MGRLLLRLAPPPLPAAARGPAGRDSNLPERLRNIAVSTVAVILVIRGQAVRGSGPGPRENVARKAGSARLDALLPQACRGPRTAQHRLGPLQHRLGKARPATHLVSSFLTRTSAGQALGGSLGTAEPGSDVPARAIPARGYAASQVSALVTAAVGLSPPWPSSSMISSWLVSQFRDSCQAVPTGPLCRSGRG